jgi:hypothetical protein
MKRVIIVTLCLFSISTYATSNMFKSITTGEVSLGDHRIELHESDFKVLKEIKSKYNVEIEAYLLKNSIQWVRVGGVLLKPRARLKIIIKGGAKDYHLSYDSQNILLHQNANQAEAEFYVSLFQPEDIKLYYKNNSIGEVYLHSKKITNSRKTHVIDYSCYRYKLEIIGLDNEFVSVGCRDHKIGKFGKEAYMVEVYWTSADYTLPDYAQPPYLATFLNNNPVELTVVNREGKQKKISIKAQIPKRAYKLKTAIGFGPYAFNVSENGANTDSKVAPAFMIYAKYDLDKKNSLRAFDALIYKDALFNNSGVYYANDVAKVADNKITITTLLGFQGMSFQFDKDSKRFDQFIFPQGLEVVYKNAFGMENFTFVYGMFLSPSDSVKYNNIWIRWGTKYFWEINYIDWGVDDKYAKTWGLSIGIPFMQFF